MKLYALYLGGRAPGCNIELHDVQFFVGNSLKSMYTSILDKWFGSKEKCHIDSWVVLKYIDGFEISLSKVKPSNQEHKLYFINLGGYEEGSFTELHACQLIVSKTEQEAKQRAKANLLLGKQQVHTDDLFDVDDCLSIDQVDGYYIHLTTSNQPTVFKPNNGYHPIPKAIIQDYTATSK